MKLSARALQQLVLASLLLSLGGVVGYKFAQYQGDAQKTLYNLVNTEQPTQYQDVDFNQFWRVWEILERDYLEPDKLNRKNMVEGAIGGLTSSLGDPYTYYLPPADQQRSKEDLQGSFYGVGIQLGYVDQTLAVMTPLKGTPAEAAGLQAGDLILKVTDPSKNLDEETTGWSLAEAVEKIRGKKGTDVTLTILREDYNNNLPFEVAVGRGEIVVPSVELSFEEYNGTRVAHLEISRFGERTTDELDKAIGEILIERPNIAGIVLDLRNNPGGFFDGAIEVAGEFMKEGVVVSQQGKFATKDFPAKGRARLANVPLVIVVNRGSASASEILAGALRDQRETKLIGQPTFGKGTVQDARELEGGAGLHVTVARWLLPDGDWIHEAGIPVDEEVTDNPETEQDEILQKAIEQLQNAG